jgi:uncharacterized protein (DUF488 family)
MLTLFTIGYEGLTIDDLLQKIQANGIEVFVDVRNNPHSRKRGFSKKSLQPAMENLGINYIHIPELGIPSTVRKKFRDDITHLLQHYATDIIPQQEEAVYQLKNLFSNHSKVVIVCFKKNYRLCHRHQIIDFLAKDVSIPFHVSHL